MLGHHRPGLRETGAANPRGEESRPLGGDTAARANRGERVQRRAPRACAPPAHAYQHISGNRSSTARTRRDPSIRSARCMPAIPKEGRVGGVRGGARGASQRSLDARSGGGRSSALPSPIDPESGASLPRRAARGGRARARGRPPGAPRGRESGPRADRTWYAAFASLHFAAASFRMSGNGHTGSSSDCAWAREWARGGEGVSATRNAGGDELGLLAIALEILVHLVRGACTPGVSPIIPITRFTF